MSDPILKLSGLEKRYQRGSVSLDPVLMGADLELKAGEVVALVAPSGAGKSTLLHIAGLLDETDKGSISLLGREMVGLTAFERTQARLFQIGFVYQFHHLLPEFSAIENVILPQIAAGQSWATAKARAASLLEKVGLEHRGTHRPAELSGGEQQRVAFCRALANAPKLLLADEPTGNLDPANSGQLFDTLLGLVRETGMAALIATHNLALAEQMDRKVELRGGVLI